MILRFISIFVFMAALHAAVAQVATLKGVVTDSQRKPLPGAELIAVADQQRYWTEAEMAPLATARTDSSGEFLIEVPTTGPIALVAWAPSHRTTKYNINPDTAKSVRIGMALEPGVMVRGHLIDRETGRPIEGAMVGPLVAGLDTEPQRALRVMPQWVISDSDGSFKFRGVAPDMAHQFIVQADGYIITNVELAAGKTEVDVPMDRGGFSVSGEVFSKGTRPGAFADIIVRANGNGFDVIRLTDSQGQFLFEGLPGGTFSIEPLLMDSNRATGVAVVEMPKDDKTSISLEVSSGYFIRGTAVDVETSTPANQVPVGLNDSWSTSSADGTFSLGPFYQGQQLTLQVPEEDGWQLAEVEAVNEYNATDGFADVNDVTVRVRRQRLFEVTLGNFAMSTQPVTLNVLSDAGMAIRKDVTSATEMIPVFQAGTYTVYGVAGGLATGLQYVTAANQKNIAVPLALGPAASASGRVTMVNTDETTRVRQFILSLHAAPNGEPGAQLFAGTSPRDDGSFHFPAMPTGEFLLSVSNETSTKKTSQSVTLVPGLNTLPDIQWEAGNRIAGRVLNPQGQPVPFAQVTLLQQGEIPLRLEADEDGKFRAEDLVSDELSGIVAEAAAFATYREYNVSLPADDKNLVLQPIGRLVVLVEAAPSTNWDVYIVRMSRWAVGAYADQLIGQSIFTREVVGGEALETGIAEEGRFRAVAINKASGAMMVSESFNWEGERAEGKSIYLTSTAAGAISGSIGTGEEVTEVTAINTAVPETAGREHTEFRVTTQTSRYQLTGLPAGNYLVLGAGEAASSYALNVELTAGGTATANLDAVPLTEISGAVELGGGPLPGVQVRLVSETESGSDPVTIITDDDGRFVFEGLTPDAYSVSAEFQSDDEEIRTATSVTVKAGEKPSPLRLDLTPPQPVLLHVQSGVNLSESIPVQLMNTQSRQLVTARWTREGLEANATPGRYEVWSGDAVVGVAEVADDGTGTVMPQ